MTHLTHFDSDGQSRMVDVSQKPMTARTARASGQMRMSAETLQLIRDGKASKKGNVLEIARVAGIMGAKRTSELVPLCHLLPLDAVRVEFQFLDETLLRIEAEASVQARTGVEMEALMAVSVAALTIYDMCKAVDRTIVIEQIQLEEKEGGRSGHYQRTPS